MVKEHFYWIDWMKVLGIYFIIAGHMFSQGSDYIYTFSVPLFFAISGFLCHYELDNKVFWTKVFYNLVIPCFLMCVIVLACEVAGRIATHKMVWSLIPKRIFNIVIGNQGKGVSGGGLGMCWFIYTLIVCKLIFQYVGNCRLINMAVVCFCLIIAFIYNNNECRYYNSILNATLAYPIFIYGGSLLRVLSSMSFRTWKIYAVLAVLSLMSIVIVTRFNGSVRMFGALYGNNLILFLLGSFSGIVAFYSISMMIQRFRPKMLTILSSGTILILGFHNFFLIIYKVFSAQYRSAFTDYVCSVLILMAFVPIILLTKRYFPLLLGRRNT